MTLSTTALLTLAVLLPRYGSIGAPVLKMRERTYRQRLEEARAANTGNVVVSTNPR